MKHRSKKRRDKRIERGLLIALVVILLGSFFFSFHKKRSLEKSEHTTPIENKKHIKGPETVKYKLVEYSDFQCPACRSVNSAVMKLRAEHPEVFSIEFKHFPLRSIHGNAQIAAQAAEAAGLQGKFWEMHDLLFEKQSEWNRSVNPKQVFKTYAKSLGLDVNLFTRDLKSDEIEKIVNGEYDEARALGLNGTPSFLLDGKKIDIGAFIEEHIPQKES